MFYLMKLVIRQIVGTFHSFESTLMLVTLFGMALIHLFIAIGIPILVLVWLIDRMAS